MIWVFRINYMRSIYRTLERSVLADVGLTCVAVFGGLIGSAVHDTTAFGLDAMFPAVILALIVKDLRDARTLRAALAGAAVALVATPFLPAGLPVLLALTALLLLVRTPATKASTSPGHQASTSPGQEPAAAEVRTAP